MLWRRLLDKIVPSRWTAVGKRMVVKHWYPSSSYPCGKPVFGIAERER
jgi:hypothetical protein